MKKLVSLIGVIAALVFILCFNSFATDYITYKVNRGDTIVTIAKTQLKDPSMYTLLVKFNNLTSPDQIKPGIDLKIPFSISKDRRARVNFVQGKVAAQAPGGTPERLNKGDYLVENHAIQTGSDGRVEVVLDEGSVVRIGANTKFRLNDYSYNNDASRNTNVHMDGGNMTMRVTRLTNNSEFNVSTVTAVAGVRGTFFYVNYEENSNDVGIAVYSGAVTVKSNETSATTDNNITVEGGFATVVRGGSEVEKPFPIPSKIRWIEEDNK